MESSPNSIEMQIDSFLEHFKRSASKAMDADWVVGGSSISSMSSSCNGVSAFGNLTKTRSRSSCLDVTELSDNDVEFALAESKAMVMSASRQHVLQSQSSVNSTASIQTVLHQTDGTIQTSLNQLQTSIISNGSGQSQLHLQQQQQHQNQNHQQQLQSSQNHHHHPSDSISSFLDPPSAVMSGVNGGGESPLNIGDVADLLHPQHAIITGGRSTEGCPLIIFPDNNNFHVLEEADYQKLILYLTSVPSMQDADLGYHLIIDRRKDKWTSVKAVLHKISIYFPGIVHVVYVLRPAGLFQKAISEVSTKFSKDEYRFRLVICSALTDLHEYLDQSQLTLDMGGTLVYSHHEWIQQRISLEKFSSLTHQVSNELDIFIQVIHDTEFPNSVDATQKLLDDQGADYDRLKVSTN
ncbi:guanine nucleotide exchange factor DBS-like [Eupeodes corollae]|uniref:guanine nucleotide exchange factor DBS-like n=1 Tax=Eupeodes corollae TaxID=290404 RepID=UPI0024920E97|nr:guanine nucleotide exchange factor DBS-like [Eupeodes corollae]